MAIINGTSGIDNLIGTEDADTIDGAGATDAIWGNGGNDLIYGGAGGDVIDPGPGNDTVYGGSEADVIYASLGDDLLDGENGPNTLTFQDATGGVSVDLARGRTSGALGNDTITRFGQVILSRHSDVLQGSEGNDQALASDGDDTLLGGAGNDTLSGDEGDDVLSGGTGNDFLTGGDGNDTVYFSLPRSSYTVTVQAGIYTEITGPNTEGRDTLFQIENIVYGQSAPIGIVVTATDAGGNLSNGAVIQGTNARDTASFSAARAAVTVDLSAGIASGPGGSVVLSSIEAVVGSAFADALSGNADDNLFAGGFGDDTINGGEGSDTADYADANNIVTVDLAQGSASGGSGNDRLSSVENATGSAFGDTLKGSSSANRLDGGAGADRLEGGGGADIYVVDNAGDLVLETNNSTAQDGAGDLQALDIASNIDTVLASISYTLGNFVEVLELSGQAPLAGTGNSLANLLVGNAGHNVLTGLAGNDEIDGGDGFDTASFSGAKSTYTVLATGPTGPASGQWTVTSTSEGTDTLVSIERLAFSDVKLAYDVGSVTTLGNAGSAALLTAALLGKAGLANKAAVGAVMGVLDAGVALAQACDLAVSTGLINTLAGGSDTTSFSKLLLRNLTGSDTDATLVATLVGLVDSGAYTRGALINAAAVLDLNQANINLTGLAGTGVEYL